MTNWLLLLIKRKSIMTLKRTTMQRTGKYILIFTFVAFMITGRSYGQSGFQNVTSSAGLSGLMGAKAAWADYNNDGWVDLYTGGRLWRNDGASNPSNVQFSEISSPNIGYPSVWGDYDNDGYPDAYNFHPGGGGLYRNLAGNSFSFISTPTLPSAGGQQRQSRGATWGDFDNDGFLDLYVGGYEIWDPQTSFPDAILHNEWGTSFVLSWTQSSPVYRARGVTACDFDEDGDIDIYVSNYRLQPNLLWLNDGNGNFVESASTYGVAGDPGGTYPYGHTIGSAWGDLNNDGYIDLFVGNFRHNWGDGSQDYAKFYENLGPTGVKGVQLQ